MEIFKDRLKEAKSYMEGTIEAVDEKTACISREYKKNVCKNFISISPDQIDSRIGGQEYYLTRKYDGEMNVIYFNGEDTFIINAGGKVRMGIPCIEEAGKALRQAGIKSAIIPAELYVCEMEGRTRVFDVLSVLSKEEEIKRLCLAPFDIIEVDGEIFKVKNYFETYKELQRIFENFDCVRQVACTKVTSKAQIKEIYKKWVEIEGSEGIVLRTDLPLVYKIKPKHTVDLVVVGYTEGSGEAKGLIRTLLLALATGDNKYQIVGKTGNGFTEEKKKEFLERLSKITIESDYIEADSNHVAFRMVRPEMVIEVSYNDVIFENSTSYITNTVLEITDKARLISSCKGISFIFPIFVRVRDDKKPDTVDTGMHQVTDIYHIPEFGEIEREGNLPKSEVLFREVYKKETKGKLMVQKFLVWKTNKEKEDSSYPAYVMHYTNFSSDRKEPLQREIRISNSEEQIFSIATEFIDENVKKGWVKV